MLDRPILFLATSDPVAARAFYEHVLGLPFVEDSPAALVFDVGGTQLRIQKMDDVRTVGRTVLGWEVSDIDEAIEALRNRGAGFETYPHLDQSANGVWTSPSGAKVAWFRDPDGNTLSLTQP